MKQLLMILVFGLWASMNASELIHQYLGDYHDVVRVVFVVRQPIHYNSLLDTDNRLVLLSLSNTTMHPSILEVKLEKTLLLDHVEYNSSKTDLSITLHTSVVYYAEIFHLQEDDHFKIVIDIYRQREPVNLEQAHNFLAFYKTVGYKERAAQLQRRIERNDFLTPYYPEDNRVDVTRRTSSISSPTNTTPQDPPNLSVSRYSFETEDPMQYVMPTLKGLTVVQQNWVYDSFAVYLSFKELRKIIENAEKTLKYYDQYRSVDVDFLQNMTLAYNSLSDANIRINEIKLQFYNLLQNKTFISEQALVYTEKMINHIYLILDHYKQIIADLQAEYGRRLHN